jgi:hypothetical protein
MEQTLRRLIAVFAFLFAITLIGLSTAHAEEGHHSLGIQGGHVGLSDANLSAYGNNIGYGAFFDYAASDYLEIELGFLTSKHTNNSLSLSKNAYSLAALYIFDQVDIFIPYLRGGAKADGVVVGHWAVRRPRHAEREGLNEPHLVILHVNPVERGLTFIHFREAVNLPVFAEERTKPEKSVVT